MQCARRLFALVLAGFVCASSPGQTYQDLHDFGGAVSNPQGKNEPDGFLPNSPVLIDKTGNLWGTAQTGGANDSGMVWEFTTTGSYIDVHDFDGTDGSDPTGRLAIDTAGDIFGTTVYGGAQDKGVLWEISASGVYSHIHDFGAAAVDAEGQECVDGEYPDAGVIIDSAGNICGTAQGGGPYPGQEFSGGGILWEWTAAGKYTDLHDFGGTVINANGASGLDGSLPQCIVLDSKGDILGAARAGGPNLLSTAARGAGMVFEFSASGAYTDLHDFGGNVLLADGRIGPDGASPFGTLALDQSGDLYGTTTSGGPNLEFGVVGEGILWEIPRSGTYRDLHDFGAEVVNANGQTGADGIEPTGVALDASGNLYGDTTLGGSISRGMVWKLGRAGVYQDVHDFGNPVTNANGQTGPDGTGPTSSVTVAASGAVYGVTASGGPGSTTGILWVLAVPPSLQRVTLTPPAVVGGSLSTGTVLLTSPAPSGGLDIMLGSNNPAAVVPNSVTIPSGQLGVTFAVTTIPVNLKTTASIVALYNGVSQFATLPIAPPSIQSITVSPTSTPGGFGIVATVTLNGPAPDAGANIALSGNSRDVHLPASVAIQAGMSTNFVTITSAPVRTKTVVTIKASYSGVARTCTLTLNPPALSYFAVSAPVTGGTAAYAAASLNGFAPAGGWLVTLSSNSPDALPPATITVPAGQGTAQTLIPTLAVAETVHAVIEASSGGRAIFSGFDILPPVPTSVVLTPATVTGGSASSGAITINGPAPAGGLKVRLTSSSEDAKVPLIVIVPAGKTTVSFTITTLAVKSAQTATISAYYGTASASAMLTIDP
jgi:hypothetical protein